MTKRAKGLGCDETAQAPITVANFRRAAEALFDRLKAEFEASDDEPRDLVVDLVVDGDIDRDFTMTREMPERLATGSPSKASRTRSAAAASQRPFSCGLLT